MRLLIGGSSSKIFHLKEFSDDLRKKDIETLLVNDTEYVNGYPSRNYSRWLFPKNKLKELIQSFRPDLIFVDRPRHFALESVKQEIPTLVHLRGDFWKEIEWAKETIYKKFPKNMVIKKWESIGNRIFENATCILPICKFLEKRTHDVFPVKSTHVMYQGINPENWFFEEGMRLRHPCVGLIQSANIWGKAKEMLILRKALEKFPNITFYWAGDGPYAKIIVSELSKFDNFKWLGNLEYPGRVRKFLSEIDIYALISGIDMAPLTLLEAQLMKKPVMATSVGGIPELMIDNKTGFLVRREDESDIIEKIPMLLDKRMTELGESGRSFVSENFSLEKISHDFLSFVKKKFDLS